MPLAPVVIEAFLAEFFGIVGGLVTILIEKSNVYCRAHAVNAICWGVVYIILWVILVILAAIAGALSGVVSTIFGIICAIIGLIFFAI